MIPFEIKVKIGQEKWYLSRKWHNLIGKFGAIWDESQQKWYLQVTIAEQHENSISPLHPPKSNPKLTIFISKRGQQKYLHLTWYTHAHELYIMRGSEKWLQWLFASQKITSALHTSRWFREFGPKWDIARRDHNMILCLRHSEIRNCEDISYNLFATILSRPNISKLLRKKMSYGSRWFQFGSNFTESWTHFFDDFVAKWNFVAKS